MSTYVLARNTKAKKTALYRDGVLKVTWEDNPMMDNEAYIQSQIKMWVGVSGDPIEEVSYTGAEWPEKADDLKPKAPPAPKPAPKVAKDAKEA